MKRGEMRGKQSYFCNNSQLYSGRGQEMAVSDDESKFDEMERDNLQSAISVLERRVNVFEQGEASLLAPILQNMKGRVATLEKKIKESQVGKENHAKEIVQYVQAVEKEKALSAPEKETFSDFLKEEFFTKNDSTAIEPVSNPNPTFVRSALHPLERVRG